MNHKFWFWWDVAFAAYFGAKTVLVFALDGIAFAKVLYPIMFVAFVVLTYLQSYLIKENNDST